MTRMTTSCDNMNHRRANAPVAYCPQCGAVVNDGIARGRCEEQRHADARRRQCDYCTNCGQQLIVRQ
jgi:predicted RNA-binding Zn-ribbon protein involved in translation (DUF1610 family)